MYFINFIIINGQPLMKWNLRLDFNGNRWTPCIPSCPGSDTAQLFSNKSAGSELLLFPGIKMKRCTKRKSVVRVIQCTYVAQEQKTSIHEFSEQTELRPNVNHELLCRIVSILIISHVPCTKNLNKSVLSVVVSFSIPPSKQNNGT